MAGHRAAQTAGARRNSSRTTATAWSALVNDILDVQSFESGDLSLTVAPVDADALLEEALELNQPFLQRHNCDGSNRRSDRRLKGVLGRS